MIEIKFTEEGKLLIGDIYVKVDIQFKPMICTSDIQEKRDLQHINTYLDSLSFTLKQQIEKTIEEKLDKLTT